MGAERREWPRNQSSCDAHARFESALRLAVDGLTEIVRFDYKSTEAEIARRVLEALREVVPVTWWWRGTSP